MPIASLDPPVEMAQLLSYSGTEYYFTKVQPYLSTGSDCLKTILTRKSVRHGENQGLNIKYKYKYKYKDWCSGLGSRRALHFLVSKLFSNNQIQSREMAELFEACIQFLNKRVVEPAQQEGPMMQ